MTNEDSHNPNQRSKPAATLAAFGAMLSLVATKVTVLVDAVAHREDNVPALTEQMRGALDVVEAGIGDVRACLDTIDGGGA
jgi:hypothetical protein